MMWKKNGDDEENISSSQKKTITISSSTISSCSSLFPRLPSPEQSNIITNQPANQPINQPTNQPTNQSTSQPTTKSNPSSTKKKKKRKKETLHPHGNKANQTSFPKTFLFPVYLRAHQTKPTKTLSKKETLKKNST